MEYRNLGDTGLLVSAVGLGGNNFGGRVDATGTKAIVDKAFDLGVTFFDTADVYQHGLSEEYLGAALKPYRHEVVIATKSGAPMGEGPYWAGTSRRYLMPALEACLRRLQTDYIDLYIMHRWDPRTPMEETLRTLDDMVRSGKVRYLGCSLYSAAHLVEALWTAQANHLQRYACTLQEYNLLARKVQADVLPLCQKYGVGLVPIWPLANGLLTGKYRPGEPPPPDSRLAKPTPLTEGLLSEANFATIAKLEEFGRRSGHTLLEIAIGWLLAQSAIPSVIVGATSPEQIEANVKAGYAKFDSDEIAAIDSILAGA